MTSDIILDVRNLRISTRAMPPIDLVEGVSFQVRRGEVVGIVGETGSGKTLCSLAISRLVSHELSVEADALNFLGHNLLTESDRALKSVLGTKMASIFQDPMSSLNPSRRIGGQMVESVRQHKGMSSRASRDLALQSLGEVGISSPQTCVRQYPHELSGGMRQRVMIAMALMLRPELIIADEPTTALDVTIQAQVLTLISRLNRELGCALVLVSHNIALLSEICDRIVVMFRGKIVEHITVEQLMVGPKDPYTRALLHAVPDIRTDGSEYLDPSLDDISTNAVWSEDNA